MSLRKQVEDLCPDHQAKLSAAVLTIVEYVESCGSNFSKMVNHDIPACVVVAVGKEAVVQLLSAYEKVDARMGPGERWKGGTLNPQKGGE